MFKQFLDTDYDINEQGECFSHKTNKLLKPSEADYPTYCLTYPDGTKKKTFIHRMVALTFLPNPENKEMVNHIDRNTKNYNLTNLEWATASENCQHAIKTELKKAGDQTINLFNGDLENEIWKDVLDYPNYKISNIGRIINHKTKRLLKLTVNKHGYYEVNLWKDNHGKTSQIHRLVFEAFKGSKIDSNKVINHIDGNKLNNNLENLEEISRTENNLHAFYVIKTNKTTRQIAQYDKNDNFIQKFESLAEAKRKTGVNNISRAANQGTTAGGYYWKYI